MPINMEI